MPNGNSPATPLRVSLGERLEIQGWAASDEKTGEAFDGVYVIAGSRQLRALDSMRPDVAKYFQNPRLNRSGFEISMDTSALQRGAYALKLVGITKTGAYYRCTTQVFVRIE